VPVSEREIQRFFHPHKPDEKLQSRKDRFDALNRYVSARNGWIVSVPGQARVVMECIEESALPDELRELGYNVTAISSDPKKPDPDGWFYKSDRILPHAITTMVITEGSTAPIRVTHAGIVPMKRFAFSL